MWRFFGCFSKMYFLKPSSTVGGGFKYFLIFNLIFGEMIHFDEHIF